MKLSMWILADKLQSYSPEVGILSGKQEISGVRPLLPGKKQRKDILYISRVAADGTFGKEDFILCVHGTDWIKLHATDVEEIMNVILDIFEAFQEWHDGLEEAVLQGRSAQQLVDSSSYVLPFPMVVTDAFGNVVGYSKTYDEFCEVDAYWNSVVKHQHMNRQVFSEVPNPERRMQIRDWDTTPRIYQTLQSRVVGMHLALNDEIVGTMILIELGGKLTRGVCQLVELMQTAMARALSIRDEDGALRGLMTAAEEYLDGKSTDTAGLWKTICSLTDRGDGELELVLMKHLLRTDFTYKNNLAYRLTTPENACFAFVYHDYVAAVISCEKERAFFQAAWKMLQQSDYLCGTSLPFSDVAAMQKAGSQAELALTSCDQTPGTVSRCVDYAYTYFLERLADDRSLGTELRHPGLARIRKYDEKHGTDFYETLYRYLVLERNVVATAKQLNIHRNSMLYRLQRIRQLLEVDLEDAQMRMYLLLSYQIEQVMERRRRADLFAAEALIGAGHQLPRVRADARTDAECG